MTFGEKLSRLRREQNYTQEQLADLLGVSRQAVGRWENDVAFPETEKLIRLSELFHCSLDYLLKDEQEPADDSPAPAPAPSFSFSIPFHLTERKSKKTVHGLPLWHIGRDAHGIFAFGVRARGVVAVGLRARGIVSAGVLSLGVLSLGVLSLGAIAVGTLALGLLSVGCFAAGLIALGSISLGLLSIGSIAIGDFAAGALAIGKTAAFGDHAYAAVALGDTKAVGEVYQHIGDLTAQDLAHVRTHLDALTPAALKWIAAIFQWLL